MQRWCLAMMMAALAGGLGLVSAAHGQAGSTEVVQARAVWDKAAARPGDQRVLAVQFEMEDGFHIRPNAARLPKGEPAMVATAIKIKQAGAGLTAGPIQWPKLHKIKVDYTSPPSEVNTIGDGAVAYIPFTVSNEAAHGQRTIELTVHYQSCDDRRCYAPADQPIETTLTIGDDAAVAKADAADAGLFENFDQSVFAKMRAGEAMDVSAGDKEAGDAAGPAKPQAGETADWQRFQIFDWWSFELNTNSTLGFVALFFVAALGGLTLNFTPCVLPVIPLKIMGLAQSAGDRMRTLLLGAVMSAGVAGFWAGLGLLMASVSGFLQTNQLFQYPAFTITVGVIIAAMAVGMCGLFTVQLPRWVYSISPRQDSVAGSFGFGIMTAVLSTPCTAPFMGAAAAWSVGQQPATTVGVFLAIGIGMALPYLALSASPKLVERMPRTGPGSELLKQVLGLLMLAAAAFFLGNGVAALLKSPDSGASLAYWWVIGGLIVAAGGWLAVRTFMITNRTLPRAVWGGLGVVLMLGVGVVTVDVMANQGDRHAQASAQGEDAPKQGIDWQYYTASRFKQAKAQGKVVVMDFTADWCLNCKVLEHTVLQTDRVMAALAKEDVVPMKVDLTGGDAAGQAMLKKVDRVTIPLLVVFSPDGKEVFKSDAYNVPQVLKAIEKAKGGDSERRVAAAGR